MSHFKVTTYKPKRSPYYQVKWTDPVSGRVKMKSTKTKLRREAERFAARLEKELRDGTYFEPTKLRWKEFRARYEAEAIPGFAKGTAGKIRTVFNAIENIINPNLLSQIDTNSMSKLVKVLRERGREEVTILSYLKYTHAALKWAFDRNLIRSIPNMPKLKRVKSSKVMKGRPITGEEFDRMLSSIDDVVNVKWADGWRHLLRGLWFSGLRLSEALDLWWDRDDKMNVDLSGKFPMLYIKAETEKGFQDRQLPITPDFAEFLQETPEEERTGKIFKLTTNKTRNRPLRLDSVSKIICKAGKKAGIIVHQNRDKDKIKFASAHDLRRSFGERWAKRLMPAILQHLMRHESIETTLRYYVGQNAETVAQTVWDSMAGSGGTSGGAIQKPDTSPKPSKTQAT